MAVSSVATKHNLVQLIGSRTLFTARSGIEVNESIEVETYVVPPETAQSIVKAHGLCEQLEILLRYLKGGTGNGYWIETTDVDDEGAFINQYGTNVRDQYISQVIRKKDLKYKEIQDMHRAMGSPVEPYSYLFVQELPEVDHVRHTVDRLIASDYELVLQVR